MKRFVGKRNVRMSCIEDLVVSGVHSDSYNEMTCGLGPALPDSLHMFV